jgi:hypothetical protein
MTVNESSSNCPVDLGRSADFARERRSTENRDRELTVPAAGRHRAEENSGRNGQQIGGGSWVANGSMCWDNTHNGGTVSFSIQHITPSHSHRWVSLRVQKFSEI